MRYEDYVHLLEEVIGYPEPTEPVDEHVKQDNSTDFRESEVVF